MKTKNISDLRKSLSSVLKQVRSGKTITVCNRNDPVALTSSYKVFPLSIFSSPTSVFSEPKCNVKKDIENAVEILRAERDRR